MTKLRGCSNTLPASASSRPSSGLTLIVLPQQVAVLYSNYFIHFIHDTYRLVHALLNCPTAVLPSALITTPSLPPSFLATSVIPRYLARLGLAIALISCCIKIVTSRTLCAARRLLRQSFDYHAAIK